MVAAVADGMLTAKGALNANGTVSLASPVTSRVAFAAMRAVLPVGALTGTFTGTSLYEGRTSQGSN
jgi:hypothetical protein